MTDLILEGVTRRYGANTAVEDVSLTLRPGRITALLGPSGSGKTTLMRLIAGLERLDAGTIRLGDDLLSAPDRQVPAEQRGVGLVFQDYALFPHMTVLDNVGFGLTHLRRPDREARSRALLEQVGLSDRAGAWPHALSGGEQQRVALIRALAREPRVLLLDEPFSGLDRSLRTGVRDFLFPALRASGAAVAVVTHDVDEALLLADDLVLMSRGRVVQSGSPADCYRRPASPQAARLLGDVTVLEGVARGGEVVMAFGGLPAPEMADGPVQVVLRPEGVRHAADGLPARITHLRFAGGAVDYHLERESQSVVLRAAEGLGTVGDDLRIALDPSAAHVFAA